MTKYDIKNYLEKIYKINVKDVRTRIKMGEFKKCLNGGYIIKDDDIKVAYAILVSNLNKRYLVHYLLYKI